VSPHLTQCGQGRGLSPYQVAPCSTQPFGHYRYGPKIGGAVSLWDRELGPHLRHCGQGQGLPPTSSGTLIDPSSPFATTGMGRKFWGCGCAPLGEGELGPHLTQCGQGPVLPIYQVASWSIQLFGHNRHGPKIGGAVSLWGGELGPHLGALIRKET